MIPNENQVDWIAIGVKSKFGWSRSHIDVLPKLAQNGADVISKPTRRETECAAKRRLSKVGVKAGRKRNRGGFAEKSEWNRSELDLSSKLDRIEGKVISM